MNSNVGNSTIESAVTLGFTILFITGFLVSLYSGFLTLWTKHLTYESAICVASGTPLPVCRHQAQEQLQRLNFFSLLTNVTLTCSDRFIASRIFIILPNGQKFIAQKTLSLPLEASAL